MSEETIVRTEFEIDSEVRDRAEQVLLDAGLTIPDLLRAAIERTAEMGAVPYDLRPADPEYDTWVRQEILAAMEEEGPFLTHEEVNREMDAYKAKLLAEFEARKP